MLYLEGLPLEHLFVPLSPSLSLSRSRLHTPLTVLHPTTYALDPTTYALDPTTYALDPTTYNLRPRP
eukprot:1249597-Rhodomonas_salina.1